MRFGLSGPRLFGRLGFRPWISFSLRDLGLTRGSYAINKTAGSYLYVISSDHEPHMVKIGVTTNPDQRIASLRTASPFRLNFSFIGCTPGPGYDIEKEAHSYLSSYRREGEWFEISPEAAAAAIMFAASKLGHSMSVGTQENAILAFNDSPQWTFWNFAKASLLFALYYMVFGFFALNLPMEQDGYSLMGVVLAAIFCAFLSAKPS